MLILQFVIIDFGLVPKTSSWSPSNEMRGLFFDNFNKIYKSHSNLIGVWHCYDFLILELCEDFKKRKLSLLTFI